MLASLKKEMQKLSSPSKAKASAWFFKTGKGQYGYGDKFLGLVVPQCHKLAKKYVDLELSDVKKLLYSPFHEHRLVGLLILVYRYKNAKK